MYIANRVIEFASMSVAGSLGTLSRCKYRGKEKSDSARWCASFLKVRYLIPKPLEHFLVRKAPRLQTYLFALLKPRGNIHLTILLEARSHQSKLDLVIAQASTRSFQWRNGRLRHPTSASRRASRDMQHLESYRRCSKRHEQPQARHECDLVMYTQDPNYPLP
jgi:hypothetical protein